MKKEQKRLTTAQEQRAISLFNDFLNDENCYLEMLLTFQAMQKHYLLSYECEGIMPDPKDRLHVVLDRFNHLLAVPLFAPSV